MNPQNPLTPETAAGIIIANATLPPQIDYVSPAEKMKVRQAEDFINALPQAELTFWSNEIADQIDRYYAPTIKGDDGNSYSVADLDAMF